MANTQGPVVTSVGFLVDSSLATAADWKSTFGDYVGQLVTRIFIQRNDQTTVRSFSRSVDRSFDIWRSPDSIGMGVLRATKYAANALAIQSGIWTPL